MTSFVDKLLTLLHYNLLTALRYRSALPVAVVGTVVEMTAFFYLARAVGPGFRPENMDYFAFLLVGTGVYGFFFTGISTFVNTIEEAQKMGTLEVLMTTSTPAPTLVVLSAISSFAGKLLYLGLYILTGVILFGRGLLHPNLLGCALILLVSVLVALAIAVMAASAQVALQRGGVVLWLLGTVGWLLSGTLFPVAALPVSLRYLAALMPTAYSIDGLRLGLIQGASLAQMARPILILGLFCIVLLPLSLLLFSAVLRRARLKGSLCLY